MKIRLLLVSLVSLFLFGYVKIVEQKSAEVLNKKVVIPSFLVLENEDKVPVGRAIPVGIDLFISPDHLFQKSENLFWKGERIEVLVRDFENDILVFRLNNFLYDSGNFSFTPPAVGQTVYLFDGRQEKAIQVLGVGETFEVGAWMKKNLISISGTVEYGDSGSVIFDEDGLIYGMVIGADKVEDRSYAIRSDILMQFLEENLEE